MTLLDGFGGKSYTKMGNAHENMEWRQLLKAKAERDGTAIVKKKSTADGGAGGGSRSNTWEVGTKRGRGRGGRDDADDDDDDDDEPDGDDYEAMWAAVEARRAGGASASSGGSTEAPSGEVGWCRLTPG